MSNMSYCRFQNTSKDLSDCESELEALFNTDTGPLSNDELDAAVNLIASCQRILSMVENFSPVIARKDILDVGSGEILALISEANQNCREAETADFEDDDDGYSAYDELQDDGERGC